MTSEKDLLKKLFKIATNQQKIITKLAQSAGGAPESIMLDPNMATYTLRKLAPSLKVSSATAVRTTDGWSGTLRINVPEGSENEFEQLESILPRLLPQVKFTNMKTNEQVVLSSVSLVNIGA